MKSILLMLIVMLLVGCTTTTTFTIPRADGSSRVVKVESAKEGKAEYTLSPDGTEHIIVDNKPSPNIFESAFALLIGLKADD